MCTFCFLRNQDCKCLAYFDHCGKYIKYDHKRNKGESVSNNIFWSYEFKMTYVLLQNLGKLFLSYNLSFIFTQLGSAPINE